MDSASRELAVTTYANPIGPLGGLGRGNNIILWVILIIIFLGFTGNDFGLGGFGSGCGCHKKHRHHHGRGRNNNFFGENGWFILIIFAIFFLFNDGGANTNIINVDTEDGQTI